MKKFLLPLVFIMILMSSCSSNTDFKNGKRQLENQGYTNVKNTGYSFFCCSDEDTFATGFSATDKNGRKVYGCFCSGYFKGVTIRFN